MGALRRHRLGLRVRPAWAIARHAARHTLRTPAHLVVWLGALALAGVLPALTHVALLEKRRLVCDSLLALTLTSGVAAGMLGAVQAVGGDLARRSAALVLTRPVGRCAWLAGQVAGVSLALVPLWLSLALATLWGSRIARDPYLVEARALAAYGLALGLALVGAAASARRRGFGPAWAVSCPLALALVFALLAREGAALVDWSLLPALVAALAAGVLACAVAAGLALALEPAPALLAGAALFWLGLVGDGLWRGGLGWVLWLVLPNWQAHWAPGGADWLWAARVGGYSLCYAAAVILLGGRWLARGGWA